MAIDIPGSPEDMPTSNLRWIGRRVLRKEDPSLLTGRTEFIGDVQLPGMLHAAILRSPIAHARITRVDTSEAKAMPGVVAVLTGADAAQWVNLARSVPEGWSTPAIASDTVRYVGEPVVAVAATSRYVAEDALECIEVDYEPLEVIADPFAALESTSPLVHEDQGTNVMMHRVFTWGAIDEALADAAHVFTERFRWNRLGANPMETYGTVCEWDPATLEVYVRGSIQSPSSAALGRSGVLGVPSNKVNVKSHHHGGAFGGKGGSRGTDIACMLSRKAGGRPVSWIEDRVEYLTSGGGQAWDRHYEASLAVDADGMVTGLKVTLVDDLGASGEGFGAISAAKPLAAFTGPYTIPVAQYDLTLVSTNKLPASPYRGMGPPPHFFVLEQLMDMAARELGADPAEFRRQNFIASDQFPYTIPSGNEYDSGSYEEVLDAALELADYDELRRWQAEARAEGRLVGIGVASSVEPGVFDWNAYAIVGMPQTGVPEGAVVSIDMLGNITVRVGFSHEGQGQYTLVSQVAADYFGVEMDSVRVVYLDTESAPPSFGPGGSRLGVAITGAVLGACEQLAQRMGLVAARLTGSTPEDVSFQDGRFVVKGKPQAEMSVAQIAGTMLARSDLLPEGIGPNADATHVWTAEGRTPADEEGRAKSYLTAAQAVHVVAVEIDRRTGVVEIVKYCLADDCGTRLNPMVVEGQTDGGVAQGVGAALYEEYVYDDQAQPLTTSFMDYLIPSIHEVPAIEKTAVVTPSPFTPLGAKGCGEGAIHTTPAVVMCALNDALAPLRTSAREVPASPERLWRLIRDAERTANGTDGSTQV
jgi:CO/xanthine dehydrogenase Mo-binding subunit